MELALTKPARDTIADILWRARIVRSSGPLGSQRPGAGEMAMRNSSRGVVTCIAVTVVISPATKAPVGRDHRVVLRQLPSDPVCIGREPVPLEVPSEHLEADAALQADPRKEFAAVYHRVRARVFEDWLNDWIGITDRDDLNPWKSACGAKFLAIYARAGARVDGPRECDRK